MSEGEWKVSPEDFSLTFKHRKMVYTFWAKDEAEFLERTKRIKEENKK